MVSWKKSFLYFIIMVTGYPSIWVEYFFLPLHYDLLFTKLSTNIFCILQDISISFILSTVEHWDTFIFALFVRKTCTLYDMVLKRHKMNSPNFKVYSTIYIFPCADQMGEVVDPDKQNYSIPLYEFSGSSHAVKSINFVALSRDIQNTKRKLSLSINRISYKPLRLIGCCEHQ